MADTVATNTIYSGTNRKVYAFVNHSDGTGESGVTKVDISGLTNTPTKVSIMNIKWAISGMQVKILFDHTSDDTALILSGEGEMDFAKYGGYPDPASAGGTGDILFTTVNHSADDTYTIIMEIEW